ncbi:MFS transporter [Naasia aerilata]|uniref:MFS transporter n=1 Tax=Naasia aerilata TaxID=1162966 RepID=A0ABM8GEW9_9MICO|nr:MFS transporter [Naasia aerilata]BDZ46864.1 MFS transporter [Naasia aerilata]
MLLLDASAGELGLVNSARWLPFVILALPLGVLVDRRRRKPLLVGADLARGLLTGVVVVLGLAGLLTLPALIALVLVLGAGTVLFEVTYQSFLPSVVPRSGLERANSRLQATSAVAMVGGPGLGGILVQLLTAPGALVVHAGSYLASAFALSRIRAVESLPEPSGGFRRQLQEGLRFVFRDPLLVSMTGFSALYNCFEQWIMTLFLVHAVRELGFDAAQVGLILSVGAIGAVAGAALASRTVRRFGVGRTSLGCAALECLVLVAIPFVPSAWPPLLSGAVLAAVFFLNGGATALSGVVLITIRQLRTPDRMLGRVSASGRWISYGSVAVGAALGELVGETLGLVPGLVIGTLANLSTVVWVALTRLSRVGDPSEVVSVEGAAEEGMTAEHEVVRDR